MKIEKILFLIPPAITSRSGRDINPLPPLGLGYLAAVAKKLGAEVLIFDSLMQGWTKEIIINKDLIRVGLPNVDILKEITDFKPDMVGISCQFSRQNKIYHEMFSLVKKINPSCLTLAGGAHATVCPEEILSDENCDFILKGEAESSFKELISALRENRPVDSIDGLGWKEGGRCRINPKNNWIKDLDSIPFPDYDSIGLHKYFGLGISHGNRHKKNFCPIITSRGCPALCTFCSANKVWGNSYRVRSIDNVIEEMKILKKTFKIEEIMFEDDNVTANAKRAKQLFREMKKEKFDFSWDTPNGVGVWSIDEEMLDLMKESGCIRLNFPIESGSQRVLNGVIKKPLKLDRVKRLVSYCRQIKLDYNMFFVIGMPGETLKDIWQSFKFAASCKVHNPHISIATPYPGSLLFEECKNKNLFNGIFSFDNLFIKNFTIKTDQWDEHDLKRILFKGRLYLKIMKLINDPFGFLKLIINKMKIYIFKV